MSRIRTIKPDFWVSAQIISLPIEARLFFIGIWNFCDDNGIHPCCAIKLKAEIFPVDNITIEKINSMIDCLESSNLISIYSHYGNRYFIINKWHSHQKIEKPTYKYPSPDGISDEKYIHKIDDSPNSRRIVAECSPTPLPRNGMEWNVMEWNTIKKGETVFDQFREKKGFEKPDYQEEKNKLPEEWKSITKSESFKALNNIITKGTILEFFKKNMLEPKQVQISIDNFWNDMAIDSDLSPKLLFGVLHKGEIYNRNRNNSEEENKSEVFSGRKFIKGNWPNGWYDSIGHSEWEKKLTEERKNKIYDRLDIEQERKGSRDRDRLYDFWCEKQGVVDGY